MIENIHLPYSKPEVTEKFKINHHLYHLTNMKDSVAVCLAQPYFSNWAILLKHFVYIKSANKPVLSSMK